MDPRTLTSGRGASVLLCAVAREQRLRQGNSRFAPDPGDQREPADGLDQVMPAGHVAGIEVHASRAGATRLPVTEWDARSNLDLNKVIVCAQRLHAASASNLALELSTNAISTGRDPSPIRPGSLGLQPPTS
jgi:hypothetical protein